MRLTILSTFLFLTLAAPRTLVAQNAPPELTSITHVTVIDVAAGTKLSDRTVVLQGDRIFSVDSPETAKATQSRVIDAQGAFLIPGLWDMHVHIQDLEDLPLYIANGVTGVRMMFGVKNPNELRGRFATASATPEVIIGSIILDGNPPVWEGSIILADEARKQNIPFVGHLPFEIRASEASDAGQRSIEHLTGIAIACSKREQNLMKGLRPLHYIENTNLIAEALNSFDAAKCEELFAQFRRNGTWQVPTLTVHRGMAWLNDSHFTSDPRLAYMSSDVRFRWQPQNDFRFRRWPPAEFEQHRELFKADEQMVGMMFRAGVPLLAGTDAMNPYCMPGFSLHDELALLVESGMTPLAALQSATLRPAEFLGRTADLGSIAPGKLADLVLLSADPLTDIHNTAQIQSVWLHGKYFDRAALDSLLEAAKHRRGKGKLR